MGLMSDSSFQSPYKPLDPSQARELAQFSLHPTVRHRLRVASASSGISMSVIVETLCRLAFGDTSEDLTVSIAHIRDAVDTFAVIDKSDA